MADAREEHVWTFHAKEQSEQAIFPADHIPELYEKLHKLTDVTNVLDLGCGSGLWYRMFDGYTYTGVDQNQSMIEEAHKRCPEGNFMLANGMKLPFENGLFDLIFTAYVLQHNKHADKNLVVAEMSRVLRPGGYYLCAEVTFTKENYHVAFTGTPDEFTEDFSDGYSFTRSGWVSYMKTFGLEEVWFAEPFLYLFRKV